VVLFALLYICDKWSDLQSDRLIDRHITTAYTVLEYSIMR